MSPLMRVLASSPADLGPFLADATSEDLCRAAVLALDRGDVAAMRLIAGALRPFGQSLWVPPGNLLSAIRAHHFEAMAVLRDNDLLGDDLVSYCFEWLGNMNRSESAQAAAAWRQFLELRSGQQALIAI